MEIRKNAWHYSLYSFSFRYGSDGNPTNLCSYFWRVVGGMLKGAMIGSTSLAILLGIGALVYNYPLTSLGVGAVGTVCILIASNWPSIRYYVNKKLYRTVGEVEEREPGLLRSYLEAKKDKICPLIAFVE